MDEAPIGVGVGEGDVTAPPPEVGVVDMMTENEREEEREYGDVEVARAQGSAKRRMGREKERALSAER